MATLFCFVPTAWMYSHPAVRLLTSGYRSRRLHRRVARCGFRQLRVISRGVAARSLVGRRWRLPTSAARHMRIGGHTAPDGAARPIHGGGGVGGSSASAADPIWAPERTIGLRCGWRKRWDLLKYREALCVLDKHDGASRGDRIALSLSSELQHPFLVSSREELTGLEQKVQAARCRSTIADSTGWQARTNRCPTARREVGTRALIGR